MADCHNLFTEFNSIISLNNSKRDSLIVSRKSLRKKIRKYFKENKDKEIKPKFKGQGSFILDTIVEPIPYITKIDGEDKTMLYYDVDDGIYFIGDKSERKSVQTYHNWIIEAIDGHTSTPPIDKNTCVRVIFADGHNIDLPIYFKEEEKSPELAHKAEDWINSDPKSFQDWFEGEANGKPQLIKIVRYLKAWCNYRETQRKDKPMLSGFILTILAARNYIANKRDDIALKETLIMIKSKLDASFKCYRPTNPTDEDLLEGYSHEEYFKKCLNDLIDSAKKALDEKNQKKSCENWQKHFGERFPCGIAKDEDEDEKLSQSYIATASASRPWFNDSKNG
jgi:Second Messenger Oligonucleotide or Dinucleotide Synthetase domain